MLRTPQHSARTGATSNVTNNDTCDLYMKLTQSSQQILLMHSRKTMFLQKKNCSRNVVLFSSTSIKISLCQSFVVMESKHDRDQIFAKNAEDVTAASMLSCTLIISYHSKSCISLLENVFNCHFSFIPFQTLALKL